MAKNKGGRPTKYHASYAKQAFKLCLLGATDEQMGGVFEVNELTIRRWRKKYPKFCTAIKDGKIKADAVVADSLYQRAKGYTHPEEKIFCTDGSVTRVKTKKHYPPDTAAAFIWLKNRAGWKDKQTQEHIVDKDTAKLLGLIDGQSKGKLPDPGEAQEAG